jgi:hypothetical protein
MRKELGCPGHLIVARKCAWRRHTQVDNYRISTVGDYYPDERGKRVTIGAGDSSFFETMVFRTGAEANENEDCGCREVLSWTEVDAKRYATAGEAQAGHEAMVAKWEKED